MMRLPRGDPGVRFAPRWASIPLVLAVPAIAGTTGLVFVGLLGLVAVAALVLVVCPAIWSKDETRRKAALAVLRVLRRR